MDVSFFYDVIKWKHFPRYWPFVRGIHRSPVNYPHKGQWRGSLMFSLIYALNKWLNIQWWGWWFETPSRSLWHHCNVYRNFCNVAFCFAYQCPKFISLTVVSNMESRIQCINGNVIVMMENVVCYMMSLTWTHLCFRCMCLWKQKCIHAFYHVMCLPGTLSLLWILLQKKSKHKSARKASYYTPTLAIIPFLRLLANQR